MNAVDVTEAAGTGVARDDLGVAAELLLQDDKMQAAALLLDVRGWHYGEWWNDTTGVVLEVDYYMVDRFTEEICEDIRLAFGEAQRDEGYINQVQVRRLVPDPTGWRDRVEQALLGNPTNNATLVRSERPVLMVDRLRFRDKAEVAVYEALKRVRDRRLLVTPNAAVRLFDGRIREVDFLVAVGGRVGTIEVDGATHHRKWSSDRSKDRALEDSGVAYVDHIDAEDASNNAEADTFVARFLRHLEG